VGVGGSVWADTHVISFQELLELKICDHEGFNELELCHGDTWDSILSRMVLVNVAH
jgi:hypothetical protein